MDSKAEIIPATQRSDGTWRKSIRIRKGFVPESLGDTQSDIPSSRIDRLNEDNKDEAAELTSSKRDSQHQPGVDGVIATRSKSLNSGNGISGVSSSLRQDSMLGPFDPFASCCDFLDTDGLEVFSATVASNIANEDRILVDSV